MNREPRFKETQTTNLSAEIENPTSKSKPSKVFPLFIFLYKRTPQAGCRFLLSVLRNCPQVHKEACNRIMIDNSFMILMFDVNGHHLDLVFNYILPPENRQPG
ncbi:hypothetical protein MKW98_009243 [Papaver atlanticum]|uniref:Uncharacterized protein n=1 Tax=Papaver atlanticum TaxID=357466 RepID=A0AAD4T3A3_9MAGN|nr:hypothetical protein MKW98_009243 [Papaver atlanticum]